MLSPRLFVSSALALLGLAATLGFPRTALAAGTMTISKPTKFGTDQLFDELIIDANGVLEVTSMASTGKGTIRIAARKITVLSGGKIIANAAGYAGVNAADGGAAPASGGGGKRSTVAGEPGGGGGYAGAGASGADKACTAFPTAAGGAAFAMPTPALPILGSAGGAANSTSAATAGGNGGGAILLEAADIQIDGSIEADGASPLAASGVAPGGGSGGFIAILAAHLTGTGTISARGGAGPAAAGVTPTILASNGGGGGGGVIFVHARDNASTITPDVAGGATGNCPAAASGKAGTAPSLASDPVFCVDADQDGYTSAACGGDDCNDSDPSVHPTAKEVCNGIDDNCVDGVDEGADICAAGSTCDATLKMCVGESDAGTDAGTVAGSPPKYITFESGCSIGADDGPQGALAVVGLGLTALVARRRRGGAAARADR